MRCHRVLGGKYPPGKSGKFSWMYFVDPVVLALNVHNYGSFYTQEVQFDVFVSLGEQLDVFVNLEVSSWRVLWASSKVLPRGVYL